MCDTDTRPDKSTIACGALTAAMGLFLVLQTSGLLGLGSRPDDAPAWIGVCAGVIFLAGGIAVVLQSLPFTGFMPGGDFSDATPLWIRSVTLALSLTIVGGLAAIGFWVAFGPGDRHFRIIGTFIGNRALDDTLGRIIFGAGALVTAAIFVVFAVTGMRRLTRSRRQLPAPFSASDSP
jgi:hypothetical protein